MQKAPETVTIKHAYMNFVANVTGSFDENCAKLEFEFSQVQGIKNKPENFSAAFDKHLMLTSISYSAPEKSRIYQQSPGRITEYQQPQHGQSLGQPIATTSVTEFLGKQHELYKALRAALNQVAADSKKTFVGTHLRSLERIELRIDSARLLPTNPTTRGR